MTALERAERAATPPDTATDRAARTRGAGRQPPGDAASLNLVRELFGGRAGTTMMIGLLMLVSLAATLALPLVVGAMIESVQRGEAPLRVATLMVTASLGAAFTGAGSAYLLSRLGAQMVHGLRVRIIDHALRMHLTDVQAQGSGNIVGRIAADAMQLKAAVELLPIQLPTALITLAGTLVIMSLIDWVLLLITLAGFSVAMVVVGAVVVGLRAKYQVLQEELGALTHKFICALEALVVIKSTRSEARQSAQLAAGAETLRDTSVSAAKFESLMVPAINFGQQVALLSVLIGGGTRLVSGGLGLAGFVSFLLYLLQLSAPLMLAASGLSTLQAGITAKSRFESILGMPLESADTLAPADTASGTAATAVELSAVSAGYGPTVVLQDVSLTVPATGLTSLVGPSGSGKTTVLRLIERLITAESGVVRVFGEDVRTVDLQRLRGRVAYVDQASTLVPDTVRHNLELGLPAPRTDAELYAALEKVGMAAEVRAMDDGLDTMLATGRDLSGGQCQRLALARAVMSDAPLILLDEPTSALDAGNESRLRDVVDEIARERAVLVVAHRISTVREARHVIVLEAGRVCDQGTHPELLARCDLYAELVNLQLIEPTQREHR